MELQNISRNCTTTKIFLKPSRGGLEVERWSDNRTDSASVGSNPAWECCIDHLVAERLCFKAGFLFCLYMIAH